MLTTEMDVNTRLTGVIVAFWDVKVCPHSPFSGTRLNISQIHQPLCFRQKPANS